jgi:hypothetical protein
MLQCLFVCVIGCAIKDKINLLFCRLKLTAIQKTEKVKDAVTVVGLCMLLLVLNIDK